MSGGIKFISYVQKIESIPASITFSSQMPKKKVQGRADIDWQLQTSTKVEAEAIWAALVEREAQLFKLLQEKRAI